MLTVRLPLTSIPNQYLHFTLVRNPGHQLGSPRSNSWAADLARGVCIIVYIALKHLTKSVVQDNTHHLAAFRRLAKTWFCPGSHKAAIKASTNPRCHLGAPVEKQLLPKSLQLLEDSLRHSWVTDDPGSHGLPRFLPSILPQVAHNIAICFFKTTKRISVSNL